MIGLLSLSPELMLMVSDSLTNPCDFWSLSIVCRQTRYMFPLRFIAKQDADRHRRESPPNIDIPFPHSQVPMLVTAMTSKASVNVLRLIIDAYVETFPASINGQWGRDIYDVFPLHEAVLHKRNGTAEYLASLPCCKVDIRNLNIMQTDWYMDLAIGSNTTSTYLEYMDALMITAIRDQRAAARVLLKAGHTVHDGHIGQAVGQKNHRLLHMLIEAHRVQPALDSARLGSICESQIRFASQCHHTDGNETVLDILRANMTNADQVIDYSSLAERAVNNSCPQNALYFFKVWTTTTTPEALSANALGSIASAAFQRNDMDMIRAIHPAYTSRLVRVRDGHPEVTPEERQHWGFRFLLERALVEAANQPAVLTDALPYLFVSSSYPAASSHLWRAMMLPDPVPYIDVLVAHGADPCEEFESMVDMNAGSTRWVYPLAEAITQRRGPAVFRLLHHGASPCGLGEDVVSSLEKWYMQVALLDPAPGKSAIKVTVKDLFACTNGPMPRDVSVFSSTSPADLAKQIETLYVVVFDDKMAQG